jgi:hypothetical protein
VRLLNCAPSGSSKVTTVSFSLTFSSPVTSAPAASVIEMFPAVAVEGAMGSVKARRTLLFSATPTAPSPGDMAPTAGANSSSVMSPRSIGPVVTTFPDFFAIPGPIGSCSSRE